MSRILAFLLAAATALFALIGWLGEHFSGLALALLGTAAFVLFCAGVGRSRSAARRWVLVAAGTLYTLLMVAGLGLQFNREASLFVRAGLSGFLLLGVLLSLRYGYQLNRTSRYGFHNYYDGPRRT